MSVYRAAGYNNQCPTRPLLGHRSLPLQIPAVLASGSKVEQHPSLVKPDFCIRRNDSSQKLHISNLGTDDDVEIPHGQLSSLAPHEPESERR
ncbi:MAG: hypothetical protein FRX48_06554 [Lasallia pustulata]|uniref:Uncharacterized protein n=1 Tax=Lasallia pustulata TaxID=136370 RepID=A0A5M8PKT3_9LECA|nr:MAG: hypothetical protein FRX48_06554 [Lasallia pustulata]